jgi:hypothetical protein
VVFFLAVSFCCAGAQENKPSPRAKPSVSDANSNSRSSRLVDPQFGTQRNAEPDPEEVKREKQRDKALNKERYDSLKKDTDKLLELATELKKSVDETTELKLSLEVIRKTDEIEKLAKKVRDKMKSN